MRKFLIFFSIVLTIDAHSGRTDKNGGHHDRKNGGYHYHNGGSHSPPKDKPSPPKNPNENKEQDKHPSTPQSIENFSKEINLFKVKYNSIKGYNDALWNLIHLNKTLQTKLSVESYTRIKNEIVSKAETIHKNRDEFKKMNLSLLEKVEKDISTIETENKKITALQRQVITAARTNFEELFKKKLADEFKAQIIKENPSKQKDQIFIEREIEAKKKKALQEEIRKAFGERDEYEKQYQENLETLKKFNNRKQVLQVILKE